MYFVSSVLKKKTCTFEYVINWTQAYIYIYISVGPPCGGHQAARSMKLITVNQSWQVLSAIVSLLVLVSKYSLLSAIVSLLVLVSASNG